MASLVKNMKNFADNLRVYVGMGGLPKFKGLKEIYLPLEVRIDNPEQQTFKVTELFITVFRKKGPGQEPEYLASTTPLQTPFIIKPANTTEFKVDVRIPVLNILTEGYSAYKEGFSADNYPMQGYLKADGIRIPIDTAKQTIPVK